MIPGDADSFKNAFKPPEIELVSLYKAEKELCYFVVFAVLAQVMQTFPVLRFCTLI